MSHYHLTCDGILEQGRGICLFSNGLLYEGQWKRNKEHGKEFSLLVLFGFLIHNVRDFLTRVFYLMMVSTGLGQLWTADRRRLIYDGSWERGRMQGT